MTFAMSRINAQQTSTIACFAAFMIIAALASPKNAGAELFLQCEGSSIKGVGSTIQGVIAQDKVWNPDFNFSGNPTACDGAQGTGEKPRIEYREFEEFKGEDLGGDACTKGFGVNKTIAKFDKYSFCGTDEAPNEKQRDAIEAFAPTAERPSVETIPVLQAAITILIHLPKGCTASTEFKEGEKINKYGRLFLNDTTLEGVYRGSINTWKELIKAQGIDKLACTGGESEENRKIIRVAHSDESGITHIFKEFLASANRLSKEGEENKKTEEEWEAEAFEGKTIENRRWSQVTSEGENARWPSAAEVVKTETSDVPFYVAEHESSIGYADLANVYQDGKFDEESQKGGEKQNKFWAEIQKKTVAPVLYADPAEKKDTGTAGDANCSKTIYSNGENIFPPPDTRALWNEVQAKLNSATYPICGLTYDLALRQYGKFHDELEGFGAQPTEGQATITESYLLFELNTNAEGGSRLIDSSEYAQIPSGVVDEGEDGVEEIGYEKSGVHFTCIKESTEGTGTLFYKTAIECETRNAPGSKGLYHR